MKKNRVAVLCGGPSLERGISLNSARSVLDHLASTSCEIVPIYFDQKKVAYHISGSQLYSNTPSDFDFKLQKTAKRLSERQLITILKGVDIVFPAMHGPFGEDGQIQSFLEKHNIPFVGSPSRACKRAFDKYEANTYIRSHGFYTLPSMVLQIHKKDHVKRIKDFFTTHHIKRAVVKPATGGSSIGVFSVRTPEEAIDRVAHLFSKRMDTRVVIEPFAEGVEFTTIVVQNRFNLPVAILPTEIETDYTENQVFDFRKKYLPTRQVTYHCPPRFSNETIELIQTQAEQLFSLLQMKDFARFDGWVMPDGNIWFSDFNPISGMEQNSFLFQQMSRIGFSHRDALHYIVSHAAARYGVPFEREREVPHTEKKPVSVLFGGATSERQVSLMSGTNVWLKLRRSKTYSPTPYLFDGDETVWKLPYAYTLNHTVEEIIENCKHAEKNHTRLNHLESLVYAKLAPRPGDISESRTLPEKMKLSECIAASPFVFLALHGGAGEDGTLQGILEAKHIAFNGSSSAVSQLCMDKFNTAEHIDQLSIPGVSTIERVSHTRERFLKATPATLWDELQQVLQSKTVIAKPRGDGCSSGVVRLFSVSDLEAYQNCVRECITTVPKGTFTNQRDMVEMPLTPMESVLFERFIETDQLRIVDQEMKHVPKTGWIEVTVGVLGTGKQITALSPSITIAEGEVLSVEEKFQGGTGINITPPPQSLVSARARKRAQELITQVARGICIEGYARIDAFLHMRTGDVKIIEINTLPGLTASTVLYHQGLAETPPLFPTQLLERFIENKGY
ncbi:MAG: D-alanine--D-alanine ligase [Candidatus Parcubacteria bacterium]|jgi:D-alanine--D-alanine ligase